MWMGGRETLATRVQQAEMMEQVQAQNERTRLSDHLHDVINRADAAATAATASSRTPSPAVPARRSSLLRASSSLLSDDHGYGMDEDDMELQHVLQHSQQHR